MSEEKPLSPDPSLSNHPDDPHMSEGEGDNVTNGDATQHLDGSPDPSAVFEMAEVADSVEITGQAEVIAANEPLNGDETVETVETDAPGLLEPTEPIGAVEPTELSEPSDETAELTGESELMDATESAAEHSDAPETRLFSENFADAELTETVEPPDLATEPLEEAEAIAADEQIVATESIETIETVETTDELELANDAVESADGAVDFSEATEDTAATEPIERPEALDPQEESEPAIAPSFASSLALDDPWADDDTDESLAATPEPPISPRFASPTPTPKTKPTGAQAPSTAKSATSPAQPAKPARSASRATAEAIVKVWRNQQPYIQQWQKQVAPYGQRVQSSWQRLVKLVRSLLPDSINAKVPDVLLNGLLVLVLVALINVIFSTVTGSIGALTTSLAHSVNSAPFTQPAAKNRSSAPKRPATPPKLEPNLPTALFPAAIGPVSEVPLDLQPAQPLIAALQEQVAEVSDRYSTDLIASTQANFRNSLLQVTLGDRWFDLSEMQQDNLATELLKRSRELNFRMLELSSTQGELLARSPFVGDEMIVVERSRNSDAD